MRDSTPVKRSNVNRGFDQAFRRLQQEYFDPTPKNIETSFKRLFRSPRHLFNRIYNVVHGSGVIFRKNDALNKYCIRPLQHVVASIRMLSYCVAADALGEYLKISEESVLV